MSPFKSQAQRALFYAKADRGELSEETVNRWEHETGARKLPKRVSKSKKRGKK